MKAFVSKHWPLAVTVLAIVATVLIYQKAYAARPAVIAPTEAYLSWGAVDKAMDGSAITGVTYNAYQGVRGQAVKSKIKTGLTSLDFLVTGLAAGEHCFNVSAQTAVNGESTLSNEACKSNPFGPTAPALTAE